MDNEKVLNFRFAEITDLEAIVRIYNSTIASRLVTADLEPVSVKSKEPWFYKYTSNHRPLWVIENQDQIIGWIGILPFHERIAYEASVEVSLYLDEAVRGKGVGGRALEFIIAEAPKYGVKNLIGLIFDHNEPSIKLFKKYGFDEWGHLPEVAELDGVKRGLKYFGRKVD